MAYWAYAIRPYNYRNAQTDIFPKHPEKYI